MLSREQHQELLRSPCRMVVPGLEDLIDDVLRRSGRGVLGSSGSIAACERSFLVEALDEFVAGGSADAVSTAELRHGMEAALVVGNEARAFGHGRCFLPGHSAPPLRRMSAQSVPHGHEGVHHVPGLKCQPCLRTVP